MIIMVILVFFIVISVNRRLFRYFGSYSGISVIPVILVNRRTRYLVLSGAERCGAVQGFSNGPFCRRHRLMEKVLKNLHDTI